MRVIIHNIYSEAIHTIEGSPDKLVAELQRLYPFMLDPNERNLEDIADHLNSTQTLEVEIVRTPISKSEADKPNLHVVYALAGHDEPLLIACKKARFLAGGRAASPEAVKQAFYKTDGDPEVAALLAHGLEPTEGNLSALRAISLEEPVQKTEPLEDTIKVLPAHQSAIEVAEVVQRAIADDFTLPIKLHGKHSEGTFVARDDETGDSWLLKPGSGPQNPAKGEAQEQASQSEREAAYYFVAERVFGMEGYYPETRLLTLNGKEYAAIKLLPWSYQTVDSLKKVDKARVRLLLHPYLQSGTLHKWAFIDAVLGNPDRHAQNMMYRNGEVVLIDHGSSMAGYSFDPGSDKASFVPYYLRAWADGVDFTEDPASKLRYLPRVNHEVATSIKEWVDGLDENALRWALNQFGVNPEAATMRFSRLKLGMFAEPADLTINRFWVE